VTSAVPEELAITGLSSVEEAGMTGLPSVDEVESEIVALVWGLRTPVNERPSLPLGLRLGKSDAVTVIVEGEITDSGIVGMMSIGAV